MTKASNKYKPPFASRPPRDQLTSLKLKHARALYRAPAVLGSVKTTLVLEGTSGERNALTGCKGRGGWSHRGGGRRGGGGGGLSLSCMAVVCLTIDPRISTTPERSMLGFHRKGRLFLRQARNGVRC